MNLLTRIAENFAEISAGVSVLILILFFTGRAARRVYTAKWKYWVWLALAVRLLIPVHFETPGAAVAIPSPERNVTLAASGPQNAGSFSVSDAASGQEREEARKKAALIQRRESEHTASVSAALALLWATGAAGCLLWTGLSSAFLRRRLLRWSAEEPESETARLFREECASAGIGTGPRLMRCKKEISPMMTGLVRPVLLLPTGPLAAVELRAVFRHELTHFMRRDLWYKLLLAAACAVHWFNPLVWLMAWEANRDLELSCDEAVLRDAEPALRVEYGRAILSVAEKSTRRHTALSTGFGGGKKELKRRLETILDTKKKRRGVAALCIVLALTVACGAFIAFGTAEKQGQSSVGREQDLAQRLIQTRTEYIGDASAVGRVLTALPSLPDGLTQKEIFLQTSATPYGLTVNYTAQGDEFLSQTDFSWAYRNATLLLSLIQNAGRVTFQVNGPDYQMTFLYTREQAMKREQTDVRMMSRGESEMKKFLADLNSRSAADFIEINGQELSTLLTADQARAEVEKQVGAQIMLRREQYFGGAGFYLFSRVESNQSPQQNTRYALSKDGSAFLTIENSYPLVQNLESGTETTVSQFRENVQDAQEALKQAQAELEDRQKSGETDLSAEQEKVREAEETLKKAQEEFGNRHTGLPAYAHRTDDAVESAVYRALGQLYSEPYTSGNVVINTPVIYGGFEENGGLRVFTTVLETEYELDGDVLNSVGGSRMPMELRFANTGASWELSGHTFAKDGSYFAESIRDFCAPHVGVAEKMLSDYGKNDPFFSRMKENLQEYVRQSGVGAKYFHDGGEDHPIFS